MCSVCVFVMWHALIRFHFTLNIRLPIPWWTFTNMHFWREDTNLIVEISKIREAASTVPKASVLFSYRWTLQQQHKTNNHSPTLLLNRSDHRFGWKFRFDCVFSVSFFSRKVGGGREAARIVILCNFVQFADFWRVGVCVTRFAFTCRYTYMHMKYAMYTDLYKIWFCWEKPNMGIYLHWSWWCRAGRWLFCLFRR